MQNEKRCRKRRVPLAATASPAVTKLDRQCGTLTGAAKEAAGRRTSPRKKYFFENNEMTVFTEEFYLQKNVLSITEALIGHILWVYDRGGKRLYGSRITELEAYNGTEDKASHAYNNKKTNRNATMFGKGGVSYVYLCYGIHNCLNIVTNEENIPDAILVRSLEPFYGTHGMLLNRYGIHSGGSVLGRGSPGRVSCAVKGEGGGISPIGFPDQPPPHQSDYCMDKEKLQRIDTVKAILKSINMRKLAKVCSGPGCVTKCLAITRQDDKASFFSDRPQYSREGKKLLLDVKHVAAPVQGRGDTGVAAQADRECIAECAAERIAGRMEERVVDRVAERDHLPEGPHPASEGKNISPDHCSTCNISDFQRSRFFISICPSTSQIINFYEALVSQKRENHNYIEDVYSQYKAHLLDYFSCMKWEQEEIVVQRDKRVGVAYAEEAALYDYRFLLKGHPSISVLPK
ncbi:DNA-3-methyladenine glycosylase [Plasmodium inui San Antonio 1]|uniref:DNA-3-methyladenine glycosylase II n=1 Tax=Plasmodium inui San Antonio 1 TaxID=1237626 RepID=W7AD61_9APIC|nr:DNA-3-methyladenine glycosylase [Plasmodium inui San Antonio 1]EUD69248.1 DNA-3-methyladenine glycosylase [Plasmodium inui San Antonio 1]